MPEEDKPDLARHFARSAMMTSVCGNCRRETPIGLPDPALEKMNIGLPLLCEHCQYPLPSEGVLLAEARSARLETLQLATAVSAVMHCIALALHRAGASDDLLNEIATQIELQRDTYETRPAAELLAQSVEAFRSRR